MADNTIFLHLQEFCSSGGQLDRVQPPEAGRHWAAGGLEMMFHIMDRCGENGGLVNNIGELDQQGPEGSWCVADGSHQCVAVGR